MALEALATVIDVTANEVAAANERWRAYSDSTRLGVFEFLSEEESDGAVSEAWIGLGSRFFWWEYTRGDWPTIARRLEDFRRIWPGKEIWYHSDSETGSADDAISDEFLDELWSWWWNWESSAEEWTPSQAPCGHDALELTVSRAALRADLRQGDVMFHVTVSCDCGVYAEQALREEDEVDRIRDAVSNPAMRAAFVVLVGQRLRGLVDCAAVAHATNT